MKNVLKTNLERFKRDTRKDKIIKLFIIAMLLCIAVFMIEWIVWDIKYKGIFALPLFHQDSGDIWSNAFMDFFSVNYFVAGDRNPYTDSSSLSSYPPLVLVIAEFFALFSDYSNGALAARGSIGGIISCILFFLIFYIGSFFAINRICKDLKFSVKIRFLLAVIFLFSAPLLFAFQRGNYILYALLFVLAFLALYERENKVLREISYIFLAAAFGIKLYPIAFGIILFKDKRWSALLRLAAYCAVLFFVPFFFFSGGLSNLRVMIDNVMSFSSWTTPFQNYTLYQIWYSLINIFKPMAITGRMVQISRIISYAICILCVICAFISVKRWQSLLAAALFTIYITSPSFVYMGIMVTVPLVLFLADEDKRKKDYIYLGLFIIILQPVYLGYIVQDNLGTGMPVPGNENLATVSVFLQSLALLVTFGLLVYEAAKNIAGIVKRYFRNKNKVSYLIREKDQFDGIGDPEDRQNADSAAAPADRAADE